MMITIAFSTPKNVIHNYKPHLLLLHLYVMLLGKSLCKIFETETEHFIKYNVM